VQVVFDFWPSLSLLSILRCDGRSLRTADRIGLYAALLPELDVRKTEKCYKPSSPRSSLAIATTTRCKTADFHFNLSLLAIRADVIVNVSKIWYREHTKRVQTSPLRQSQTQLV
jgi:hypothetical protein